MTNTDTDALFDLARDTAQQAVTLIVHGDHAAAAVLIVEHPDPVSVAMILAELCAHIHDIWAVHAHRDKVTEWARIATTLEAVRVAQAQAQEDPGT